MRSTKKKNALYPYDRYWMLKQEKRKFSKCNDETGWVPIPKPDNELVTLPYVDILACYTKTSIYPKDYSVAAKKNIHYELTYAPMLMNSTARQETMTFSHLLHIKGKSKNFIVSSGAANK